MSDKFKILVGEGECIVTDNLCLGTSHRLAAHVLEKDLKIQVLGRLINLIVNPGKTRKDIYIHISTTTIVGYRTSSLSVLSLSAKPKGYNRAIK